MKIMKEKSLITSQLFLFEREIEREKEIKKAPIPYPLTPILRKISQV
ncbi:hypothetical protein [Clostridium novyi]|nr:hypothetical protein [Clostridium novyi]